MTDVTVAKRSKAMQIVHERKQRAAKGRLLTALRRGDYDSSLTTHTIRYDGKDIVVTELEYLWLFIRGHLYNNYSHTTIDPADRHHITLKEHHHAQPS